MNDPKREHAIEEPQHMSLAQVLSAGASQSSPFVAGNQQARTSSCAA